MSRLELRALRIIAESVALPMDQFARFLGYGIPEASALASGLEQAGCLLSRQFLAGDYSWLWLTRPGARLSGTGLPPKGFPPAVRGLKHRRAIHEVRLYVEERAPGGRWICESYAFSRRERGAQVPDGVFEIGGERHAIEVELSSKSDPQLREVLADNSARYDAVVYFAGRRTRAQLRRLKREEDWPKLVVRDLPGQPPARKVRRRHPKRDPHSWETKVLRLISEQGAVPIDQLARFFRCGHAKAERIVAEFCRQTYTNSEQLLADEPNWVWLKEAGNRLSGTSLSLMQLRVGALPRLRALNEVRLHVEAQSSEVRWISRRRLLREYGPKARVPDAVVELPRARHAIIVRFNNRHFEDLTPRIDLLNAGHDAVICFCASQTVRRRMVTLQEECRWSGLVLRDLPSSN
jgi:hypothetical protein